MSQDGKSTMATGNAPGGRDLPYAGGAVASLPKVGGLEGLEGLGGGGNSKDAASTATDPKVKDSEGFGIDNGKDVKGSLKVHIKLDLEADIRIIARVKGDIAIGLL